MKTSKTLVAFAAAALFFVACEKKQEETKGKDSAEVKSSGVAQAVTYKVDTAASVVKWVGKKVGGQHNGTVKLQSGDFTVEGNAVKSGTLVFDLNTIKNEDLTDPTYNQKLVGHLKSPDFFDVANYPTATLTITGAEGNVSKGTLTIKGKTDSISAPVTIVADSASAKVTGKTTFDRSKFDVKYGSKTLDPKLLADKVINDEVELEFEIVGKK